jgi:CheY-like chemotaxis protein
MTDAPRRHIILAAEDDQMHQMVLRRVMRAVAGEGGIDLRFAGNGRELISMLHAGARPDLVLLDLHMPLLDGVDTVAAIRRDPLLCTTPVVMLSSSGERHHVEAAYRSGANAYLLKRGEYPVLLAQMRHAVTFWLETALLPP